MKAYHGVAYKLAADYPRDAARRAAGLEFGRPVRIGRNVLDRSGSDHPAGRFRW